MKYLIFGLLAITMCSCAAGVRWDTDGDVNGYTKAAHLSPDDAPRAPQQVTQ